MIEQSGRITHLEGRFAWVETQRQSACSSCHSGSCGTGTLTRFFAARPHRVRAENGIDAQVGDTVVIGVEEGTMLRGSFLVYLVPLFAMLGGGLLFEALAPQWGNVSSDGAAALGGLLGLGAGFTWLFWLSHRIAGDPRWHARILRHAGGPSVHKVDFVTSD